MPGLKTRDDLKSSLARRLTDARARTDELFALLREDAMYDRPIPERHRIIFYLGHFEAFDWNIICRNTLDLEPFHAEFDNLFAFGIDPVDGQLPDDRPDDWPKAEQVQEYNRRVRAAVDAALERSDLEDPTAPNLLHGKAFHVAIEHRLMHAETLAYMYHWLPFEKKIPQPNPSPAPLPSTGRRRVAIPAGPATLGAPPPSAGRFGWDNEYSEHTVQVSAFEIDSHNVTHRDYLEFMGDNGYQRRELWSDSDWEWKEAAGISHPRFWCPRGDQWVYRCMFEEIPLPMDFPVYVSHAEASAYARWKGSALPTEAQFHRGAYGTPEGGERSYPWGESEPDETRGNLDFHRWDAVAVGSFPAGNSAFGVSDLVGNGWEWTSTVFAPFDGFEVFPFYPRYSEFFFDGLHYVIKGASARTAAVFARRSYRNWFQAHYPYFYSAFRLVGNSI